MPSHQAELARLGILQIIFGGIVTLVFDQVRFMGEVWVGIGVLMLLAAFFWRSND